RYAPPSDGWDDARWIEEILGLAGKLGPVEPPAPGEIAALAPEARLDRLRHGLQEADLLPAGADLLPVRGLISVFRANHRIRYAPSINGGPRPRIVLVRAEQTDSRALEEAGLGSLAVDPALGWSAYSAGPVEVHTVPGDHMGMLAEPRVERLASLLASWL
ncbi:MAG TPA: hypothetical protein VLE27_10980, partial [Thermoanaerobaculia bacterium]|nr:hypothetical protein [Thermoanaerobaculia bacterium]